MEMEPQYYPYPPSASYEGEQHEMERVSHILRTLHERKQRLMVNLQTNPYQRHEIEAQLRQVNMEIQNCQRQLGPRVEPPQYPGSQAMTGYHPMKGNQSHISPGDSAFSSGVTTKAPSHVEDGDLEQFEDEDGIPTATPAGMPPGGYPPYQTYPDHQPRATNERIMQAHGERVQMTMFPETLGEREEVPSTQMVPGQPTNLQRLAQPAQILKAAIASLTNYQGSTELTAQALPTIARLLSEQEEMIVLEASKLILELSKKEASCQAILSQPNVINAISHTMCQTHNAEIQKTLCGVLHNLSNNRQGLMLLYNCGCIPHLVRLLTSQVDGVLFYAMTTLHNMLLHYNPAKMEVRLAGGLEKMVALLVKDNPKFLAITVDCLHILAYGHQDSKLIILASNGPAFLVRVVNLYTYEKLLWTCSRLLKVLSVCPSNKPEIVQAGGMQALGAHLGHRSVRLVQNILFTLRNLSDVATKQDHLDDLLRQLIMLLSSQDVKVITVTAGVLSNLTCNNAKNKTIVCQLHGVEALLRVISTVGGREDIVEPVLCTLRHITSRHPSAEVAQNTVRLQNGIPMLVSLFQMQCRWPTLKALIGVVRNLALSHESHPVLRDHGCIAKIWQLLNRALQDSHKRTVMGGPPGYVDGVYMDEIVEVSVGALHLLARDPGNKVVMRQLGCIPLFVQLLYSRAEPITRAAAGVLCELAQDREGAMLIERENATAPLTELLHSRNEGVAAYAAAVLFCLSEENPRPTISNQSIPPQQPMMRNEPVEMPRLFHSGGGGSLPHSAPGSGYVTPHEPLSGILTPDDLDFPLEFHLDDLPSTEGLPAPSHTPTTTQHHTQHYPPHPATMHHHGQPHSGNYVHAQSSFNPPSPAMMDTMSGHWLDSDL